MDATQYDFNEDLFRERLKEALEKKGYSKAKLSQMVGVTAATIGHYINGKRSPRGFGDLVPVARALNVSLDYLAGVVDYNYLDENEKGGAAHPRNYLDTVKLINVLLESFDGKADLLPGGLNTVRLEINDSELRNYLDQQKQLYDMVGGSLSVRAFSIALDDLNDKMRKTPLESPIRGLGDIDPNKLPF